jgi:glycosyltransferase involved in cell wall biosynthesis
LPRVLISINAAWNVVNFRAALVRALADEDGHEVIAAVPDDGALHKVAALGARPVPLAMTGSGTSVVGDLLLLWRYLRLLRRERPDIYLGWTIKPNTYGSFAARLCRVPRINNISGLGTAFIRQSWLTRVAGVLYRLGLAGSSMVFFQNADDAALFRESGLVRGAPIGMLPGSGIDLGRYDPALFPPRDPDATFRFLLIARLIRDKGVYEFVEAARRLRASHPQVRCQLLGFLDVDNRTAVSRPTLDGWVGEGLVEYLGAADDVRGHLAAADCVVLPSYREGMSRVLLEAAAMERPAIASDVPGCRDVVLDGQTGLLCAAQDAESLAEAMARMVALPPPAREAMGKAARSRAGADFSEAAVIAAYRAAIGGALEH